MDNSGVEIVDSDPEPMDQDDDSSCSSSRISSDSEADKPYKGSGTRSPLAPASRLPQTPMAVSRPTNILKK
ncbi:hypothetical protein TSAR_010743 [Trichomalopsis sarcophagae]|uniref:Uncharacterized protein n=1 Tax=Trichomalopsis sarcophagae TaxID=543379 RepID=A0A232EZE0_9HYME|nr:hypothetical protein TSAR_010743 [Trichomalopsis sarcophagae]